MVAQLSGAFVAAAALLVGCGGAARSVGSDAPLGDQCSSVPTDAARVTLRTLDRARIGGALVGRRGSPVGVVISHGFTQTLCDWLDEAHALAHAIGATILVIDRRGHGSSSGADADVSYGPSDVAVAVNWFANHGSRRIAVLGASFGAPSRCRRKRRRTTVSDTSRPPISHDRDRATLRGRRDLCAYGSRRRGRERGSPTIHVLEVSATDHSIGLLENHPEAQAFAERAIRSCTHR